MQPGDVKDTFADISAIERDIGFKPTTTIDEGVPRFVDWYREYHERSDGLPADPLAPAPARHRRAAVHRLEPEAGHRPVQGGHRRQLPGAERAARDASSTNGSTRSPRRSPSMTARTPTRPSAPFAVNQIVHRSNDRFEA